jgi:hypothetical protein
MSDYVIVDGVRLTREQIDRAVEELNRDVVVTVPRNLAKTMALFLGHNVSIPGVIREYAPMYLDIMPTPDQMGEMKRLLDAAMAS